MLVFLPGAAEIRRTEILLHELLSDPDIDLVPLYGALEAGLQDRAILPAARGRRKVVLATAIAETSLTIDGVRVVIDCGLARVPRYEPGVGLTRLETVRVSRASADQRRGRAGRTEPGVCYRLWDEPQTASLQPANRPEILSADLSGFVLDLAHWGVSNPCSLALLDQPPAAALTQAQALLRELGAIEGNGKITEQGRRLRDLPLPPRLARMVSDATALGATGLAAEIAVLLTERGLGGSDVDLGHRLDVLRGDSSRRSIDARALAKRWTDVVKTAPFPHGKDEQQSRHASPGALLALAYPDRIARSRGAGGAFLLANGRGAVVDPASALSREPFLAVAEISGTAARGRVMLAAPLTLDAIEALFAERIEGDAEISFDEASATLRARHRRRLGAIALAEQQIKVEPDDETARMLAQGAVGCGLERLPWNKPLRQWRDRVMFLRSAEGGDWPDLSDHALSEAATEWLASALAGKTALSELSSDEFVQTLHGLLPWALRRRLDLEAPTHFAAPSGSSVAIDYHAPEGPKLSIRVQELFGLHNHPTIAAGRVPLVVELLSPANRPVQVTRDLAGFWRGSYGAVRAEMKGRYPRHPWPDDPLTAVATRRAKSRLQFR